MTPNKSIAAQAFDEAIAQGRLSANPRAPNYAGHYMYIGPSTDGRQAFKHIVTQDYLPPLRRHIIPAIPARAGS